MLVPHAPGMRKRFPRHWLTGNCSKLRKIHSSQGPISLSIIPPEINYLSNSFCSDLNLVDDNLCWDQLIQILINQSLQFLHMTHETYVVKACTKCVLMTTMNYDKMKFSSRWKCDWKSSDEMGPRALSQPNLRKVDRPWKGRCVNLLINIHSSIKAIHESIIDIMDIHILMWMSIIQSWISIIQSCISIESISDIQTCIMEK